MARAFLLHFLGAYLFANGGKTVSLGWLILFQDFVDAWRVNWGQACLAFLYSTLNTFSWGTLQQLVGPWKLFDDSSLSISCILICSFQSCNLYHLANCHLASNLQFLLLLFAVVGCYVWPHNLGTDLNLWEFPRVRLHGPANPSLLLHTWKLLPSLLQRLVDPLKKWA